MKMESIFQYIPGVAVVLNPEPIIVVKIRFSVSPQ
jgi:hypothetical protein